ncbi:hypothetical protein DB346_07510 [Verrucomicrobia bacterium LW23]|nr:hypothetical protein DB346_07510 [Verrucomicrobia bacterium LW23]
MTYTDFIYGFGLANAQHQAGAASQWIQLSPYGEFPHRMGLQVVDRAAADAMARGFNSLLARLGRTFGGIPFYVGHPDAASTGDSAPGTSGDRAYGWITALEARDDGLYCGVRWTAEGRALVESGAYKFFSPYWACRVTGTIDGRRRLTPDRLISVGLTNSPNIPVLALSNLRINPDATASTAKPYVDVVPPAAPAEEEAPPEPSTAAAATAATAPGDCTCEALREEIAALRAEAERANAAWRQERAARIALITACAVAEGRITPAEEAAWAQRLTDPARFTAANAALRATRPHLHTQAVSAGLGERKREVNAANGRMARVQQLVAARMSQTGEDYTTAFTHVQASNAALFAQMQGPGKRSASFPA